MSSTMGRVECPVHVCAGQEGSYAVYQKGYADGHSAGLQEGLALTGAVLAGVSFMIIASFPFIYKRIRTFVRPWAMGHVNSGQAYVLKIQQDEHWLLTRIHTFLGAFCGVEFYISFLPLCFWAGEGRLARSLTLFMALCIYTGNAIKDVVCSPRPVPPVKNLGITEQGGEEHARCAHRPQRAGFHL